MVERVAREFGRIDVLVNNAGIAAGKGPVDEMEAAVWDKMLRVNLRGVFLGTRAVLPLMYKQLAEPGREAWHGKIINTASQKAYTGGAGLAHYTASKMGVVSFTRSVSLEIGALRVRVNCVAPGATATPLLKGYPQAALDRIVAQIPAGRLAQVDDIAPAYVYLASDESNHVVGQCISPNGGDVFL